MNATRDHDDDGPRTLDSPPWPPIPGSSTHLRPQLSQGTLLGERYRVVRMLGQGGMGTVYQALDEARSGLHVAVKLLAVHQPQALYRLKNEFRALAETVHPNLIGLHGLGVDPCGWFVVMDLIAPCSDFLGYVRAGADRRADEGRLRSGFSQLLRGVAAIHAAGKLHRDLKPSNVLVTDEGRVVVADFGLVGDQGPDGLRHTSEGVFAGTPAYAAPEQARGQAIGTKADMYAIGVLLFEALTGRLPIEAGSSHELLERKTRESAPDLSVLEPGLPRDLSALCNALLQRDPGARPEAREALALLDEKLDAPAPLAAIPFVAREAELAALHDAMLVARGGAPALAVVAGPSGIGKSALIGHFLEELRRAPGTVQLSGRCHAHEQLPFNAFDALVDALGRHLSRLAPVDAASLMPREVTLLARLFPTLLRVPAVMNMPAGRGEECDERLRRLRAFAALKELLARIADRAFLVLSFDDLQWSDDDSRELLRELLRGPGAPTALFVCALRAGDPGEDPRLSSVLDVPGVERVALTLRPLEPEAASDLARTMLGQSASQADLSLVIEEAAGSPFLLKELSRGASASGRVLRLPETVSFALDKLDRDARGLLELVCLAGQPIELQLAIRAAGVASQALPAILASGLLRSGLRAGREYLESSHQRINDAVVDLLEPSRARALHEQLARALAGEPEPDPDRVAHHFRAASCGAEATRYTIAAAARAARSLAFGRSAELYELALAETPEQERGPLELALAEVYESLGKLNEAAARFERVAQRESRGAERVELTSHAMLLFFLAGQFQRGRWFLSQACHELGVLAPPRARCLALLVRIYLLLRFLLARRMSALPAPTRDVTQARDRERIELCYRAARGFFNGRPEECTHFSLLAMIETRKAREAYHWPLALAGETLWHSLFRPTREARYRADIERAVSLTPSGDAEVLAGVHTVAGLCEMSHNYWQLAIEHFDRAERVLIAAGRPPSHVYQATRPGQLVCFVLSGQLLQLQQHCEVWIAEARALGDTHNEKMMKHLGSQRFLALDDPRSARRAIEEVRSLFAGEHTVGDADAWWLGDVALYEGDFETALAEDLRARRSRYFTAMQRVPSHRVWTAWYLGRACLLAAAQTGDVRQLRRASSLARSVAREPLKLGAAAAAQIRAGVAALRGDHARVQPELEHALALLGECGMQLHVAAIRHRLGKLRGGELGAIEMQAARAAASELGVHSPERWFAMLLPA